MVINSKDGVNRMIVRVANGRPNTFLGVAEVQRKKVMPGFLESAVLVRSADSDMHLKLFGRLQKTVRAVGSSWKEKQEPWHVIGDGTCGTVPSGYWPQR